MLRLKFKIVLRYGDIKHTCYHYKFNSLLMLLQADLSMFKIPPRSNLLEGVKQ